MLAFFCIYFRSLCIFFIPLPPLRGRAVLGGNPSCFGWVAVGLGGAGFEAGTAALRHLASCQRWPSGARGDWGYYENGLCDAFLPFQIPFHNFRFPERCAVLPEPDSPHFSSLSSVDDRLITSKSIQQHLEQFFSLLLDNGLQINLAMFVFVARAADFLGHRVDADGIRSLDWHILNFFYCSLWHNALPHPDGARNLFYRFDRVSSTCSVATTLYSINFVHEEGEACCTVGLVLWTLWDRGQAHHVYSILWRKVRAHINYSFRWCQPGYGNHLWQAHRCLLYLLVRRPICQPFSL